MQPTDELSKAKDENERLRASIEAFPDPAFYEVDEFPKNVEKWLRGSSLKLKGDKS